MFKVGDQITLADGQLWHNWSYWCHPPAIWTVIHVQDGNLTFKITNTPSDCPQNSICYDYPFERFKLVKRPNPTYGLKLDFNTQDVDAAILKAEELSKLAGIPIEITTI